MLEFTLLAIGLISVAAFAGGVSMLAYETARNKPFGNGQLRIIRKYLANEPVHTDR